MARACSRTVPSAMGVVRCRGAVSIERKAVRAGRPTHLHELETLLDALGVALLGLRKNRCQRDALHRESCESIIEWKRDARRPR